MLNLMLTVDRLGGLGGRDEEGRSVYKYLQGCEISDLKRKSAFSCFLIYNFRFFEEKKSSDLFLSSYRIEYHNL